MEGLGHAGSVASLRASGESDPGCSPHRGDDGEGRVRKELGKQFIEELGARGRVLATAKFGLAPKMTELAEIVNASPERLEARKNPAAILYPTRWKLPSTGPVRRVQPGPHRRHLRHDHRSALLPKVIAAPHRRCTVHLDVALHLRAPKLLGLRAGLLQQ
jgi:hypothetical protein